jgi:hypothetical protein
MFLFRVGRLGPLWVLLVAYRLWRRLSPEQKAAIGRRVARGAGRPMRGGSASGRTADAPSTMARVGSATAPDEEIPPSGP